jgi:hypothetical protein
VEEAKGTFQGVQRLLAARQLEEYVDARAHEIVYRTLFGRCTWRARGHVSARARHLVPTQTPTGREPQQIRNRQTRSNEHEKCTSEFYRSHSAELGIGGAPVKQCTFSRNFATEVR